MVCLETINLPKAAPKTIFSAREEREREKLAGREMQLHNIAECRLQIADCSKATLRHKSLRETSAPYLGLLIGKTFCKTISVLTGDIAGFDLWNMKFFICLYRISFVMF